MRLRPVAPAVLAWGLLTLAPAPALGSSLSGDTMDKVADWLAILVLVVVPIVGIVVFWMIHVLPEKVAHKRHHPQREAIQTLCLLSLVFGGLLWPFAWLWAYTKPVISRAAYGTDKHEDYFREMAEKQAAGELTDEDIAHLREHLEAVEARGPLTPELKSLKDRLARTPDRDSPIERRAASETVERA
jgi:CBS domain containing-hemolysin-like protein